MLFPTEAAKLKTRDLPFIDFVWSINKKKRPTDVSEKREFILLNNLNIITSFQAGMFLIFLLYTSFHS